MTSMQRLSQLVALGIVGVASIHSALAQAPGAKATIQSPAFVSEKSSLGSLAVMPPAAVMATGGKMSAMASAAVTAATADTNLSSDASMSARGVPAAAVKARLNLAQAASPSNAAAAVMSRTSFSALAIAVPSAGIVSKSDFSSQLRTAIQQ